LEDACFEFLMHDLFLYGTLKRGQCNAFHLAGQQFLGEARTTPRYRLYRIGWFPGLVEVGEEEAAATGRAIEGELWRVDERTLERLDRLEGVEVGEFERRTIELQTAAAAEAYFYRGEVSRRAEVGPCWPI
jgi:gamma-glutamylcyclotransferase (GGCT)/AIG2-like uncharacterized protein YtfP